MKLVMTLLVRDEEDVLDANLRFHLDRGVDFVIATDNRSVDGTPDILRRYEREGVLERIEELDDDYAQSRWVTRMARSAAADHGADWVINSDADEFWWPESGDLKQTLAAVTNRIRAVRVPRSDFVPVADDGRPFFERMVVREARSTNSLGQPLPPKVCHRADPEIEVAQGNHAVTGAPRWRTLDGGTRLTILHFPLRSFGQFERKIVSGGAALERNRELGRATSRTWRELYELHRAGRLEEYYRSRERSADELARGIAAGELVADHRLRDHLTTPGRAAR